MSGLRGFMDLSTLPGRTYGTLDRVKLPSGSSPSGSLVDFRDYYTSGRSVSDALTAAFGAITQGLVYVAPELGQLPAMAPGFVIPAQKGLWCPAIYGGQNAPLTAGGTGVIFSPATSGTALFVLGGQGAGVMGIGMSDPGGLVQKMVANNGSDEVYVYGCAIVGGTVMGVDLGGTARSGFAQNFVAALGGTSVKLGTDSLAQGLCRIKGSGTGPTTLMELAGGGAMVSGAWHLTGINGVTVNALVISQELCVVNGALYLDTVEGAMVKFTRGNGSQVKGIRIRNGPQGTSMKKVSLATTSGSPTATQSQIATLPVLDASDIGKKCVVWSAGQNGQPLYTTISNVVGNTITLGANAGKTQAAAVCYAPVVTVVSVDNTGTAGADIMDCTVLGIKGDAGNAGTPSFRAGWAGIVDILGTSGGGLQVDDVDVLGAGGYLVNQAVRGRIIGTPRGRVNTDDFLSVEDIVTLNGDGTTTSFTVPHGLCSRPAKVSVVAADGTHLKVTFDETNLTVQTPVVIPSGQSVDVLYRALV